MNRRIFIAFLSTTLMAAIAASIAISKLATPQEASAETTLPPPQPVTVPVQLVRITNQVVTRGTLGFDSLGTLSAADVEVSGLLPVITWLPEAGTIINEGDVVYEIAGRPAIVLPGEFPLFRTATAGATGKDIAVLQEALTQLGLYDGPTNGIYGRATRDAIQMLYESQGYSPLPGRPAPRTEILIVATVPFRVGDLRARVGDIAAGPILEISGVELGIDTAVSLDEVDYLAVGDSGTVEVGIGLTAIEAIVTEIATRPGTQGAGPDEVFVRLTPVQRDLEVQGPQPVRIRIEIESRSTPEPVLAVPLAALFSRGDSRTYVTVVTPAGVTSDVEVLTGLSSPDGMVEVDPVVVGQLTVGDLVIVGTAPSG
ncbi:MAG: peptidoglycan-binding domain-containing protein [Acidimicrobiia bacterium]|nr:MAG: peptidoglycan-binding domain-containing protein [Acidimicrobiia bacterium]